MFNSRAKVTLSEFILVSKYIFVEWSKPWQSAPARCAHAIAGSSSGCIRPTIGGAMRNGKRWFSRSIIIRRRRRRPAPCRAGSGLEPQRRWPALSARCEWLRFAKALAADRTRFRTCYMNVVGTTCRNNQEQQILKSTTT